MLTPSSIMRCHQWFHGLSDSFVVFQRSEILHDAAAEDAPLLEIMIENAAHQPFRLGRSVGIGIPLGRERNQRRAANDGERRTRLGCEAPRSVVECVMVALC